MQKYLFILKGVIAGNWTYCLEWQQFLIVHFSRKAKLLFLMNLTLNEKDECIHNV